MMDQNTAPIIATINANNVPTDKSNTASSHGLSFTKMENLITCTALISISEDLIIGASQNDKQFVNPI